MLFKTGRVVTRWRGLDAAMCFDAWRTGAMEQKRGLNSCKRAIDRMLRGLLASAFQGWVQGAEDRAKSLTACRQALTRWWCSRLAKALDGWIEVQQVL